MGFGSHDSSVGNPEIEAADEKMRNNGHALDTGGRSLLQWATFRAWFVFNLKPSGKCRISGSSRSVKMEIPAD